ncbi:MAG: hypothetical protein H8D94_00705 [Candidatus Pelagibacter sp.]|nr:hypothetical protein [Candidatus Pelagibacter sp.]
MENKELYEVLMSMDSKLNHIEDALMDYRDIIIKLVNQGNTVVEFLRNFDIEFGYDNFSSENDLNNTESEAEKLKDVRELIDEYSTKFEELQEFEEELAKVKDEITTGQIGES